MAKNNAIPGIQIATNLCGSIVTPKDPKDAPAGWRPNVVDKIHLGEVVAVYLDPPIDYGNGEGRDPTVRMLVSDVGGGTGSLADVPATAWRVVRR